MLLFKTRDKLTNLESHCQRQPSVQLCQPVNRGICRAPKTATKTLSAEFTSTLGYNKTDQPKTPVHLNKKTLQR